jgi:hypothetical protein
MSPGEAITTMRSGESERLKSDFLVPANLLMSNTDRLDGLTQCNFGLTRFTSSSKPRVARHWPFAA